MNEGATVSKAKKEEKMNKECFWCSKEDKGNGLGGRARVMLREKGW